MPPIYMMNHKKQRVCKVDKMVERDIKDAGEKIFMFTEWMTAVAASAAAIAGVATIGISVWKIKECRKKNKCEVSRKLASYMQWLDQVEELLKKIFTITNDDLTVDKVIGNTHMYIPVGEPLTSDLEKISNKTGYGLSKDEENQIESFCGLIIKFTHLYDFLKENMLMGKEYPLQFCDMKRQLKRECPKEMIYGVEKTEDSEFSEYIFAYITKLKRQWDEVKKILDKR